MKTFEDALKKFNEAKNKESDIGKHFDIKPEATIKEIGEIQIQAEYELGRKLNEKEMFNFLNFVPAKQFLMKLQRVIYNNNIVKKICICF